MGKIEFSDLGVFYKYGENITFQGRVDPASAVKELQLFIKPDGQNTILEIVPFNANGEVIFSFDLKKTPLRPFSRVEYWFAGVTFNGEKDESQHEVFTYEENLKDWKRLSGDRFSVNWRSGDDRFGQAILNTMQNGFRSVNTFLPLIAPSNIRIYVYENARELQSALVNNQQAWVAGHTSPDINVILVSIAPGLDQQLEMDRQIPHELAHIVLYQIAGSAGYERLPVWLNEGISSLAELTPNSDYRLALERSVRSGQLIPLETLCGAFPRDASSAFLSYAQSASFVQFYYQKFGSTGLISLLNQYKNGLGCYEGVKAASGSTLNQLETQWQQQALGLRINSIAWQNLAPYIFLGILILLIPLGLGMFFWFSPKLGKR